MRHVIVGAGVGGLSLAQELVEAGQKDVLLFDRRGKDQCRNKLCADGVTFTWMKRFPYLEDFVVQPVYSVHGDLFGKHYSVSVSHKPLVSIINRQKLYDFLSGGLNISYTAPVVDANRDMIELKGGEKVGGRVYGADGSTSIIRRNWYKERRPVYMCFQSNIPTKRTSILLKVRYGGKFASPGSLNVCYEFPHGNYTKAGVGFGLFVPQKPRGISSFGLNISGKWVGDYTLIRKSGIDVVGDVRAPGYSAYPIGCDWIDDDRLVGDARGAAYILTGEGIGPALATAHGAVHPHSEIYKTYLRHKKLEDWIGKKIWFEHHLEWVRIGVPLGVKLFPWFYKLWTGL